MERRAALGIHVCPLCGNSTRGAIPFAIWRNYAKVVGINIDAACGGDEHSSHSPRKDSEKEEEEDRERNSGEEGEDDDLPNFTNPTTIVALQSVEGVRQGQPWGPQPQVVLFDASFRLVEMEGWEIIAGLLQEPEVGQLEGTRAALTDERGIATFSDLRINGRPGRVLWGVVQCVFICHSFPPCIFEPHTLLPILQGCIVSCSPLLLCPTCEANLPPLCCSRLIPRHMLSKSFPPLSTATRRCTGPG